MMINKQHMILWTLLITSITATSCKTQQDSSENKPYEPHTEHQYYIEPENDTLLLHLFKITMPQDDIISSHDGKVFIEIELDTAGNVTNVNFVRAVDFILSEETKENIELKIKKQVKFKVSEEAKNYYLSLASPIKINLAVLGKSLKNE